jgi:DNA-binding PadR family transcriptional regulator
METPVEKLIPLTPAVLHILLALVGGERHGYGIMREVATGTDGAFRLGPGTLYRSIKQMLGLGLIVEGGERIDPALDDERRKYYRITERGRAAARLEAARLARTVQLARERGVLGQPQLEGGER